MECGKDEPDCDKLSEMMAVLSTREESFIDLDKGIEDKTEMDDLETELERV